MSKIWQAALRQKARKDDYEKARDALNELFNLG